MVAEDKLPGHQAECDNSSKSCGAGCLPQEARGAKGWAVVAFIQSFAAVTSLTCLALLIRSLRVPADQPDSLIPAAILLADGEPVPFPEVSSRSTTTSLAQDAAAGEVGSSGDGGPVTSLERHARSIFQAWSSDEPQSGRTVALRRFQLQDCEGLQRVYREECWNERPPSGEDPAWSAIRDPRINASTHPLAYSLGFELERYPDTDGNGRDGMAGDWMPGTGDLAGPMVEGPSPPWVVGSDADNYPLTRLVQRDIWLHQHPPNCSEPHLRFWYTAVGPRVKHGLGTQINLAAGALGLAMSQGRVLVLGRFDRAEQEACAGPNHARLSCYFLPETSVECQRRMEELLKDPKSSEGDDPVVKLFQHAHPMAYHYPPIPRLWGEPWLRIPAVIEGKNQLITINKFKNKYRWWRAQAYRYLLRAPSAYTCDVVNQQRHASFGMLAAREAARAEDAISQLSRMWKDAGRDGGSLRTSPGGMEAHLWSRHTRVWVPRPLVAVHVRMGDKAREMEVVGLDHYMALLLRIRQHDPAAANVWLSTEMQQVVDEAQVYSGWNWYFSSVPRIGRSSNDSAMPKYEQSLGVRTSVENALANLYISLDADYFVGALGSAWSYLIDGLRCTGGKMNNGFLSVNISPRWHPVE